MSMKLRKVPKDEINQKVEQAHDAPHPGRTFARRNHARGSYHRLRRGLCVVCRQRPALNHHQRHKSCILPVKLFFKSLAAARDLCYGNKIGFCEIHKVRFQRFLIYAESEQTLEIEKKIRC